MRVAVIFPGQGTQATGLGAPWREHEAWSVVERAGGVLDQPLVPLLLDPAAPVSQTRNAQLVVLIASLMAWEAVAPVLREAAGEPVAFAGHSLGQLSALVAAGVLTLEDGAALTARRASHTQRCADSHPGRLAALLGASVDVAREACEAAPGEVWLANDNAPGQVVVGGTPGGVERAGARAKELGARRVTPLDVGGAFHTPLMEPARRDFELDLADVRLRTPSAPVVANTDARPYVDDDGWRRRLAEHLVNPVRWRESMERLAALGADTLVEVGPGSVLAGLARRTVPDLVVHNVATPTDLDTLAAALTSTAAGVL